jgi:hypothetical protein
LGAEQLVKHLKSTDNPDKWEAQTFIKTLRSKILQALNLETFWQESQDSNETRLRSNVEAALRWTIEDNLLYLPKREVLSIWPSIDINTESLAPASIIESIKRSLTNPDNPITRLHFVGVSLKFSLPLITEALQELADTHERGLTPVPTTRSGRKKSLQITLVHMDDQSHILHALDDQIDIKNVRTSFHERWSSIFESWGAACSAMEVELPLPTLNCIDYIPPRVGLMIDGAILYAGRCSFPKKGEDFHLLVGENEYFLYDLRSPRGRKEIEEFKEYLAVYSKPPFYGIRLLPDGTEWITELDSHPGSAITS